MLSKPIRLSVLKHIKGVIKKKTGHTQTGQPHLSDDKLEDCRGRVWPLTPPPAPRLHFPTRLGNPTGTSLWDPFLWIILASHLCHTPRYWLSAECYCNKKRGRHALPPITGLTRSKQGPGAPVFAQSPPALTKPSRREQIKLLHQRHIFSFLTMMTNFWFKVSPEWHLYPVW